ncbi:MAG: dTMP kinase [Acidimicrobiales bacterium]|mgnify:FL=1|jgi:dTMP kinase|nr:dTMP kinase [Acidimicrobiales bacterium]MDP6902760.1 dTMP kinase [Acidimicrobiales bacterium]HJL99954.1 dTMP kinase [Acidimicrobiales bacterium]
MNRRGKYIAFEGWEASGKSTQARLLSQRLDAVLTREPGGTDLGLAIRDLLLGDGPAPTERAEALLFAADRAQHLAEVVEPALAEGRDVITDRSYGSTLAYQGYGRGQSIEELMRLVEWTSGGVLPDLVVLLTVAVDTADGRLGDQRDRMESEDVDFAKRVIEGFGALAEADPNRWVVVDGAGSIEEVAVRVAHAVGVQ